MILLRSVSYQWESLVRSPSSMMLILFLMVRRAANLVAGLPGNSHEERGGGEEASPRRITSCVEPADNARLEAANSNENLSARIGQDLHDGPIRTRKPLYARS